jgi:enamine deaminase RidA (YjgF/YER057c/UK114 family)
MIRALSLAAALAVLPLSAALAQDEAQTPSEAAIETASAAFEARMEAFGERAEAIGEDRSLTETQREIRIAALWTEYQPDVTAFTTLAAQHASAIAAEALAEVKLGDLEALRGVVKFPVRIKCATLSWNTLTQGLDEVAATPSSIADPG